MVNTDQPDRINVFPRDSEPQVRTFVEREFLQIIAVTESPRWRPTVTIEHVGRGWVRATYGPWDIRIETSLVQTAMTNETALWALRRTIAHEIGHAMSGHRFTTAARQQGNELEADAKGIEYFKRLGWSCKLWVDNFARGLSGALTSTRNTTHRQDMIRLNDSAPQSAPENLWQNLNTCVTHEAQRHH